MKSCTGSIAPDPLDYEVKKTTKKPTQLATTPTAEYELMNISGKNSYFAPKIRE